MVSISSFILPFLDPDTIFFILLIGFLFYELLQFLSAKKENILFKGSEIEKLLWFVVLGVIIYSVAVMTISTVPYMSIYNNPIGGIILSHLKIPFFVEFFNLNNMINLLFTKEWFFGSNVLVWMIFSIIISFVAFLGIFHRLEEPEQNQTENKYYNINLILPLYLFISVFINSFFTFAITLPYYLISFVGLLSGLIINEISYKPLEKLKDKIKANIFTIYFMTALALLVFDFLSEYLFPHIPKNLWYGLGISLFSLIFISTVFLMYEIYKQNDKIHDLSDVIAIVFLTFVIAYSSTGLVVALPRATPGIYGIQNVSNLGYSVSGYIFSENSSKLNFTNTIAFYGKVRFTNPYNYTYISILNISNFSSFPPFYRIDLTHYIKNGLIPPGKLITLYGSSCSYPKGINCSQIDFNNQSYILITRNNTIKDTDNISTVFFYEPYVNISTLHRELNYSYTEKNCSARSCILKIDFNPEVQAPVLFQNLLVSLPYNYTNITISVSGQNCTPMSNAYTFGTTFQCYNQSNSANIYGASIEYLHPRTNYINIINDILYEGRTLGIIVNMSN